MRAALQVLIAEGLIERVRGHSARVRGFRSEDAIDLYRARRPLELEAVRLVIESWVDLADVEVAFAAFQALREPVAWDLVADADIRFHRAVVAAAGSPRLLRLFDSLGSELRLLIAQLRPAYRDARDLVEEHRALLLTLQEGALGPALEQWNEHLDAGEAFFLAAMEERSA